MSTADEIAKLAVLREAGDITTEEFQAAKTNLLGATAPDTPTTSGPSTFHESVSDDFASATEPTSREVSVRCGKCGHDETASTGADGWMCGQCGVSWYVESCGNCNQPNVVPEDLGKMRCTSCGQGLLKSHVRSHDLTIGDLKRSQAATSKSESVAGVVAFTPMVAAGEIDNSRVWLLAVVPLLLVCIDAAFLYSGVAEGSWVGFAIAVIINTAIVIWDSRSLKRQGYDVSAALGFLFVPGYIAQRSNRVKQSQFPLVTWIVAFVIGFGGSVILENHFVNLDMNAVTASLTTWVDKGASVNATVQCPDRSVYAVHSIFLCAIRNNGDSTDTANVQVTVENSDGDITWQALG